MNISISKHLWDVFLLFMIPGGGGIPAGVILGESRGVSWASMTFIYFCSDIVLACIFEPLLLAVVKFAKTSPKLRLFIEAYKESLRKTGIKFGLATGPFALVVLSFGVDPMTGRVATRAAGHGFFSGWAIAICGDMFFFGLIMSSCLWLNSILGDGTLAAFIIMLAMFATPIAIAHWKRSRTEHDKSGF